MFNRIRQVVPICTPSNGSWTHASLYSLSGILIGSAVSAELTGVSNTQTRQTDRQTDRPRYVTTSVAIARIYA